MSVMITAMLGILFTFALCCLVAAVVFTGYGYVFRVWTAWLVITTVQAFSLLFAGPHDVWWWTHVWAPVEILALALAAGAVAEAIWLRTRHLPVLDRFHLRFGLFVGPASLCLYLMRINHGDWFGEFVQVREWVWMWLGLTFFAGWLFFAFRAFRCSRVIRWHAWIFMLLILAHAVSAPQLRAGMYAWLDWQRAYRLFTMLCVGLWLVNCSRLTAFRDGSFPVRPRNPGASPLLAFQAGQSQTPCPASIDPALSQRYQAAK